MTRERRAEPFDDSAALIELERLRESIAAARQARQRVSDEFDAFVKGFRNPAAEPARAESTAESRPSEPAPSIVAPASKTDAVAEISPSRPEVRHRYRLDIRRLGIAAVIAVVALGLLLTRWRNQTASPTRANTVTGVQSSTGRAQAPTSVTTPAAKTPAVAAHAVVVELQTVRPVWMRVVVDSRKTVERTVPAGESLHFTGDNSIVVRVGNGGDVLVKTGSREDPFGAAGQPATRTFSKP